MKAGSSLSPPTPAIIRDAEGRVLRGDDLELYCQNHGLCPLCARTKIQKRVVKLFKKNKWVPQTIMDKDGNYISYNGYCVRPGCFSLEQAKQLSLNGESRAGRANKRGADLTPASPGGRNPHHRRRSSMRKSASERSIFSFDHSAAAEAPGTADHIFPSKEQKQSADADPQFFNEDEVMTVVYQSAEVLHNPIVSNSITVLDLSGVKLRLIDLSALSEAIQGCDTLEGLILENCGITDEGIHMIGKGLLKAGDRIPIEKIYLRSNSIEGEGLASLCKFLEKSTTLEKLDLSRNKLNTAAGVSVFSSLQRNNQTTIRCLNISHNELWTVDEGNHGISSFLKNNSTLQLLNLEAVYLNDECLHSVTDAIRVNKTTMVERLYLGFNGIGDDGATAIAAMIAENDTIKILGLGDNAIRNDGARALLAALDQNKTLQDISGLWNNIIERRFIVVAIRRLLLTNTEQQYQSDHPEESSLSQSESQRLYHNHHVPLQEHALPTYGSNYEASGVSFVPGDVDRERYPMDRLVVFQSAPLTFFDRQSSLHRAIPLLDHDYETESLRETFYGITEGEIEYVVQTATMNRFTSFIDRRESRIVHISCFGDDEFLPLENGFGSLQGLTFDGLQRTMAAVGGRIQVVVVSSVHAKAIGNALVKAGIPHVVCCQRDKSFRDQLVVDFAATFYSLLAESDNLKEAFEIARDSNHNGIDQKFQLLPEKDDDDRYHSIPVFFTDAVPSISYSEPPERPIIPAVPSNFLGREVDMFEIIEAIRVEDLVRVSGPPGVGKDSIVAASCKYMLERKDSFHFDCVFRLPEPPSLKAEEDTLYGDLSMCISLLRNAQNAGIWDDDEILECRERIEIELEDQRALFAIDDREFRSQAGQECLELFIDHFLEVCDVKVILIASDGIEVSSKASNGSLTDSDSDTGETSIEICPLDFKSTALLFGRTSMLIRDGNIPSARSAEEFSDLCFPPHIADTQQAGVVSSARQEELFKRMGEGYPAAVISAATNFKESELLDLFALAHRPEVSVDSLGKLKQQLHKKQTEKEKAISEKNYFRAMNLEATIEDLESMRDLFPSVDNLREEEKLLKKEFNDAVSSRQYDLANDLKREMLELKKKIMKEKNQESNQSIDKSTHIAHKIRTQVSNMMEADTLILGEGRTEQFVINCGDHDCRIEIKPGILAEYYPENKKSGIICWTNESCELQRSPFGADVVTHGGSQLETKLQELPSVASTPWGPVRCKTGNATLVGPTTMGDLNADCLILAVGPVSAANTDDVDDGDLEALHFIRTMLRSSYRSALAFAREAGLQHLALSMLTTFSTGVVYEDMVRIGLETVVEEVKRSGFESIQIIASTPAEASRLIDASLTMGIQTQ